MGSTRWVDGKMGEPFSHVKHVKGYYVAPGCKRGDADGAPKRHVLSIVHLSDPSFLLICSSSTWLAGLISLLVLLNI